MCGISGYLCRSAEEPDRILFQQMNDLIRHRGPDDEGIYYCKRLALGHRRLSIIDLSKDGHQPMRYNDRYVIIFNGEIYNYLELREELQALGYGFQSQTDTEVLVASYACWGAACQDKFNGMWSFAIYDEHNDQLFCSRDRFGVKPFYYYVDSKKILFGSEIKQILPALKDIRMNIQRIWDFLCCGIMEYGQETFFEDVFQLPGGWQATYDFQNDNWKAKQWYQLSSVKEDHSSFSVASSDFASLFKDSVRLRLRADVPVGSCLSGGLDSSAIVCATADLLQQNPQKSSQHTISSCYDDVQEAGCDEQEYMDMVAEETGVQSHKIFLRSQKVFDDLDRMIWHQDEPFTTTSICAQWAVFEEAKKQGLTVMLDGQGADEQMAGYSSFFSPAYADLIQKKKYFQLWRSIVWFNKNRASAEGIRAENYFSMAMLQLRASGKISSGFFVSLFGWLVKLRASQSKFSMSPTPSTPPFDVTRGNPHGLYNPIDFRQFTLDMVTVNLVSLLHFEDRNSMAHSIESRVPFLDYRLVEKVFAMPSHYKLRCGVTKAVMREGLKNAMTEKVRTRYSKLGFATPEDVWIKNNPEWFRKELSSAVEYLGDLLEKERVLAWFDDCLAHGTRDFYSFRIICLGRWAKIFKVQL